MIKLDLKEIKKAGIYTVDADLKNLYSSMSDSWYYLFYIDVRSWNNRLKSIIKKRIESESVYLIVDVGKLISPIFVQSIQEFEEISIKIDELVHHLDEYYLNKRIVVTRKDGSEREVEIMFDKATEKYAYVNLTTHHICPCRFDTMSDAVDDMRNDDFVVDFKLKDEEI